MPTKTVQKIQRLVTNLFRKKGGSKAYSVIKVENLPEKLKNDTLYLVGDQSATWTAALACPCQCGSTIKLNLRGEVKPRWIVSINQDKPTLSPSVWRTDGCRSHFFLKNGKILWC